jgi:hypothetical protein
MFNVSIPDFKVGMVVVTPTSSKPFLTEDRKYVILSVADDKYIQIQDDTGETRYYHAHLFIEADTYYGMTMWLSTMRVFDLNHKDL